MFYSKTTKGFYDEEIHGARTIIPYTTDPDTGESIPGDPIPNPDTKIPLDAVAVTKEQYQALMDAQASGKVIVADADGFPVAQDPPDAPYEVRELPYLADIRKTRELILNRLTGMYMAAQASNDTATCSSILQCRQDLLDLTTYTTVAAARAAKDYEALRLAVKLRYKELAAAVPSSVRTAFLQVDA